MKRVIVLLMALCFPLACGLSQEAQEAPKDSAGTYRASNWFETEILYVQDRIAIEHTIEKNHVPFPRHHYELGSFEWGGEPELVGLTGDVHSIDSTGKRGVSVNIRTMSVDDKQGLLFGQGHPDWKEEGPYFLVPYKGTGRVEIFKQRAELEKRLGRKLGDDVFMPPDMVFRWLVSEFQKFKDERKSK